MLMNWDWVPQCILESQSQSCVSSSKTSGCRRPLGRSFAQKTDRDYDRPDEDNDQDETLLEARPPVYEVGHGDWDNESHHQGNHSGGDGVSAEVFPSRVPLSLG